MQQRLRILLGFALACALAAGVAQHVVAQTITTGTINGVVMDSKRAVVPGATVVAVHVPTGTTYTAVTGSDGHYSMPAVRVGGPYTVKASMAKFRGQEQGDVQVALGETRIVDFTLDPSGTAETVTVTAEAQIIDTTRAGTAANVGSQIIQELPSIARSINDFARTSPYFNTNTDSAGGSDMISVAGRNNRYNNMQIDGAVNNDVFGLASTGTPGGQTGTQPVSLDAIQEIQLVVSPYDVRQGGFSGGGINAVTKSGTNNFHGTGYFYGRNQDWVRGMTGISTVANPNPGTTYTGNFSDKQVGFSVGGPVVKNRVFFFTNFDWARKATPAGYSADGSSGQTFSDAALIPQVIDIAKTQYGFNPGGLTEFSKPNNSNKVFARGDFNLTDRNQLTARVNYVDGLANVGTQYNNTYNMPDHFYHMTDKMLSSVAQLNTSWGHAFNEFRATYQRERNLRGDQPEYAAFPEVRVDFPSGNYMYFGTEYSSQANALNQDIVELTDDFTLIKGSHEFSIGTHNEIYKFYNLFIQNAYGSYRFSSIANFQAGLAQSYNHNFSNTSNPLEAARWSMYQLGFYAGDKWRVRPSFVLTYGFRIDIPRFPDTPHANPIAVTDFGMRTDIMPAPSMLSPRAGFNWDLSHGGGYRSQLRGGAGLFTGRTPYVWISNQYSNTGVDFTSLSVNYSSGNKIPFVSDPNNQPTSVTGGTTGRQTINLVDPDYKYPEILRTNIAYDHDLHFLGLIGTGEVVYTWNLKDIYYKNLNYVQSGTLPDGRQTYKKFDSNLNDVMLLTNTTRGKSWSVSYKVERRMRGIYASGSYLFGRAYSRNDGTSSVARSNWTGTPVSINTNDMPVTRSRYDVGHRINLTASVPIKLPLHLRSTASMFYNGQQGFPYSLAFNGDANGDGVTNNDLLYIPSSLDQVVLYGTVSGQPIPSDRLTSLFTNYLNGTAAKDYPGQIYPRNASHAQWMNNLDIRYAITVPTFKETHAEVTIDVLNFLNLLNSDWGWQYFGSFPANTQIGYGGIDSATGKMRYNLSTIGLTTYQGIFTRDDLRSRAQAQIGIRFVF